MRAVGKHDDGRGAGEKEDAWSDLGEAAVALQRELRRFEEMAAAARRMPLHTRKGIERAAKATAEAAAEQDRVAAALGTLVGAIHAVRERHEANAAALTARGEEIRARAEEFGALYERYSAIGEEGASLNRAVQEVAAKQGEATTPERIHEVVAAIEAIEARMTQLADSARDLGQAAAATSLSDLAELANTTRQQVAAARNKLGMLRSGILSRMPDASKLN
jgi:chromosome segregation ATPase